MANQFVIPEMVWTPPELNPGGRPALNGREGMTNKEYKRYRRRQADEQKAEFIAVLDSETDPFDNVTEAQVMPFVFNLYSPNFGHITFWKEDGENDDTFAGRVVREIERLPDSYVIYAHNGGKFDYMFLLRYLKGSVKFKGRGIMSARIGQHELRDSFHIIPEKLANWKKDDFDYSKLRANVRHKHKDAITSYVQSDCSYLYEIVLHFIGEFGFKISIGQAAMARLRENYKVKRLSPYRDAELRNFFYGGRVECLQGKGEFTGPYSVYDVNSMYPFVMANFQHPIGNEYVFRKGVPGPYTCFVTVRCNNYGALIGRDDKGATTANIKRGTFFTTIHEFNTSLEFDLIDNVEILAVCDCEAFSDFSQFVIPLYEKRQATKTELKRLDKAGQKGSVLYNETLKNDMIYKYTLNNGYGKFAQNPRRYRQHYVCDAGEMPPHEWFDELDMYVEKGWITPAERLTYDLPQTETGSYTLWQMPSYPHRYNNVGTGASITGAARSVLLRALQGAVDPIYCDTDSIICRELDGVEISDTKLGAWKLEHTYTDILIAGKKLYACRDRNLSPDHKDYEKIRSKGVAGLSWHDMERILFDSVIAEVGLEKISFGPTITKAGAQNYLKRRVRATAPLFPTRQTVFDLRKRKHG